MTPPSRFVPPLVAAALTSLLACSAVTPLQAAPPPSATLRATVSAAGTRPRDAVEPLAAGDSAVSGTRPDSATAPGFGGGFDAPPRAATPLGPAAEYALQIGLENVRSEHASTERVSYENRRFRHPLDAFGRLVRGGRDLVAYEQRLGLTAAMIQHDDEGGDDRFTVRFPTDRGYVRPPGGPRRRPTSRSLDLLVGPLFAYDLGRLDAPIQFQIQTEVTARYNPWPGSRLTGSIVFPMYNDFSPDDLHPDIEYVRPGLVTVEQFAWVPAAGIASGTAGLFADNRWGVSFGLARPFAQGALLLDAQTDVTGFVSFADEIEYSEPDQWSSFGGVTWRPPWRDVALRARYAQFLYGDRGVELAFTRAFGDFEIVLSATRSEEITNESIRLVFPIPPLTRPTGTVVRPMPVERFPINYRTDATPVGLFLVGAASREEFLKHLSKPGFESNRHRYDRARGVPRAIPNPPPILWANHSGTTGFVLTPWAGVQPEGEVEAGYSDMPRKWAYNPEGIARGVYRNEIYYANIGLLPRLEAGIRITRTPGFNALSLIDPLSKLSTDTDHMFSFRVSVLEPRDGRPGVAVGVDDAQGTRRYHSTYAVAGVPFEIFHVQNRFSLGYAPRVFTASRHVLDGAFSAFEVSPWRSVAARFEYDTEKFNVGLGVDLGFGLRIRAAALNMESLSAGVGWHHKL